VIHSGFAEDIASLFAGVLAGDLAEVLEGDFIEVDAVADIVSVNASSLSVSAENVLGVAVLCVGSSVISFAAEDIIYPGAFESSILTIPPEHALNKINKDIINALNKLHFNKLNFFILTPITPPRFYIK
jgi:hypothetical protein